LWGGDMKDHLIKEENLSQECGYCHAPVSGWKSTHDKDVHYKTTTCSCGKEARLKVDFIGNGDDEWNEKKKKG